MSTRRASLAVVAGVALLGLWQTGKFSPDGVAGLLRTALAAVVFLGVSGYGPARLLLTGAPRRRVWLYTLPIGAATGPLTLTLLGLLHVPLDVALMMVFAGGFALAGLALLRTPPVEPPRRSEGGLTAHVLAPLAVAFCLAGIACVPSIRMDYAAVQGQNGDAILAVGTANFLQHAPPGTVRPELGLDRVPVLWRSKLPIYYNLAAVSRLAGQDTITAFTGTAGVMLGLAAVGFFLLALDGFGVPVLVALGAMVVVGLDRMVMHAAYGPFYNQLCALFALPFAFLFGWRFLREPDRGTAALAAIFIALALFTYPLLLPFPLVFLAVIAWRRRREHQWWRAVRFPVAWPRGARVAVLAAAAALAVPVALVLGEGILEKLIPAARAIAPGGDLGAWSGNGVLPFFPVGWFVGVSASDALTVVGLVSVLAAALYGAWHERRDGGLPLAAVVTGGLLGGLYLLARDAGELFYFKDLSFTGPLIVLLAVIGLAALKPRWLAVAAIAVFAVAAAEGTREEGNLTSAQTTPSVLELRDWDRDVPTELTIRIDVPPSGWQMWAWYMMPRHRLSTSSPLGGIFPYPPYGRVADLALVFKPAPAPEDSVGPPIGENDGFALYELRDDLLGPDRSSQQLVEPIPDIKI